MYQNPRTSRWWSTPAGLLAIPLLILSACERSCEQPEPAGRRDTLTLEGPLLKAVSVATGDLLALEEENLKAIPDPKLITEFNRCFTRLEAYDVRVSEEPDHYTIAVIPVAERCLKSGYMKGGGGDYTISKDGSFRILKKEYGE